VYLAGRLETKNVAEYDRAAAWAKKLGLSDFLPDLAEMAAVEVEHKALFFGVLGRPTPGGRGQAPPLRPENLR